MSISSRLEHIRETIGKSQREMSKEVGASPSAWRSYESGASVPGGKVLEKLVQMGFNVNWLLTGEGPKLLEDIPISEKEGWQIDELDFNVIQATLEEAGNISREIAEKYAHMSIDLISLIAEMRTTLPSVDEIKRIISVIRIFRHDFDNNAIGFDKSEIMKIIDLSIKGRELKKESS